MHILKSDGKFHYTNTRLHNDKYITPMITDSHLHLLFFGESLLTDNIDGKNLKEIQVIIEDKLREDPDSIVLNKLNEDYATPTKEFLDSLSTDVPIYLVTRCGHGGYANQKVFDSYDFSKFPGCVDYEKGKLLEAASGFLKSKFGRYTDTTKAFLTGADFLISKGIRYAHSDDIRDIEPAELPFKKTKLQVYEKVNVNSPLQLKEYHEKGYFNICRAVKVFLDGSFGGRSAYMSFPYKDTGGFGLRKWAEDDLADVIKFCENNGYHLCMHAIGDRAIDIIIDTFKDVRPIQQHRIIHASCIRDDQIQELKPLKLIMDVQPKFIPSDRNVVIRCLGEKQKLAYRFKDLYDNSFSMFYSSDAPVETPDWISDIRILQECGLPLDHIVYSLTYAPENIDNFPRDPDKTGNYLIFDTNPFDKITKPEIGIEAG